MKFIRVNMLLHFLCLIGGASFGQQETTQPKYNYAYSCDGYNQDRDDVAASAMTVALFDYVGWSDRLVHFHFNINFGGEPTHAEEHRKSALQTAVLFGIIEDENGNDAFFDVARLGKLGKERTTAIDYLAGQISKASTRELLMIFAAGGVQLPYLSLKKAVEKGANKSTLESVIFISHAEANEITLQRNTTNPDYANNWEDLEQLSSM